MSGQNEVRIRNTSNLIRFTYIKLHKSILLQCNYANYILVTVLRAFTKVFLL
jgi:hypothetical protein